MSDICYEPIKSDFKKIFYCFVAAINYSDFANTQ